MSETEHLRGKLIHMLTSTDPESVCKLFHENNDPQNLYEKYEYDSYLDWFNDTYYREYYLKGNSIYMVEYEELSDSDIFIITEQPDGNYNFEVKYYNGGCGFSEALDFAVNKLK